jgi:hypothetical protein
MESGKARRHEPPSIFHPPLSLWVWFACSVGYVHRSGERLYFLIFR